MTKLTFTQLLSYNRDVFTLITPDGGAIFHIPWDRALMTSVTYDSHNVCLSDGVTAFRLDVDDWNRLNAVLPIVLERRESVVPYTKCCK